MRRPVAGPLPALTVHLGGGDVAVESAGLVKAQILQQVGSSVLAQANQQPQIALQLLRGV